MKVEQQLLRVNADAYHVYTQTTQLYGMLEPNIPPKEAKKLRGSLEEMRNHIEGNID